MGAISTVDTHSVTPNERLNYWNAKITELIDKMSIDSNVDQFDGQILHATIGRLNFIHAKCSEAVVSWPGNGDHKPKEHCIVLHLQNQGHCVVVHKSSDDKVSLRSGELALCDNSLPYDLNLSDDNDMLALSIPIDMVVERVPDTLNFLNKSLPNSNPHVRLLNSLLLNVHKECQNESAGSGWIDGMENVLIDLLKSALKYASAELSEVNGSGRLQKKLLNFIQDRLADPKLSTAMLAKEVGISVRTVQTQFARMGTTPTAYILKQRLALAAKLLRSMPQKRITDIAYDAGFNDSAYFTRRFRQFFGQSPRDFRAN